MLAMLPLETLPGWPEAPDPSLWMVLAILVAIPLAITIPVLLIHLGPTWFRQTRATKLEPGSAVESVPAGRSGVDVTP